MQAVPVNFTWLHDGEEFIRVESLKAIEASDDLKAHLAFVAACMDLLDHFARQFVHTSDDQMVIQKIGIRLFNGCASAVQLMLSGYYQSAVMMERDLLEVAFLLDYMYSDQSRVADWKSCDEATRNRDYAAAKIRIWLDNRDGFTEKKRAEHYKLLCTLASLHLSPRGLTGAGARG